MGKILETITYFKKRIKEKSTWAAIGIGIPVAAALEAPWSFVAIAVTIAGVLAPTS